MVSQCPECDSVVVTGKCKACGWREPLPAFVTEKDKPVPICVRCGIEVPGCKVLYTVCKACADKRLAGIVESKPGKWNGFANIERELRNQIRREYPSVLEAERSLLTEEQKKMRDKLSRRDQ